MNPMIDEWGTKRWHDDDGYLHRDDGPAVINIHGAMGYYQHGKLSRLDGPAAIYNNGDVGYWKDGELHRLNGPAIDFANKKEYYIEGEWIECVEHFWRLAKIKAFL
jgi:hypothetical protein